MSDNSSTENQDLKNFEEESSSKRYLSGWNLKLVGIVAISWTLFQLWYASPFPFIFNFGQFIDVPARAIHLCFGLTLCFLIYPSKKKLVNSSISIKGTYGRGETVGPGLSQVSTEGAPEVVEV